MKKSLLYIFMACLFFNTAWAQTSEKNRVLLQLEPETVEREATADELTGVRQFEFFLVRYKHFHDKYPGDLIFGDITDEVARVYSHLNQDEIEKKAEDIQSAIKYYRYFYGLYEKAKEQYLTPKAPPLVVAENEYDSAYQGEYIYSPNLIIVKDFKKVLAYGMDERDFEAVEARAIRRLRASAGKLEGFYKLSDMLGKLEWRKLFYYGIIYDNPFSGKQGIGDWTKEEAWGMVRLISEDPTIYRSEIKTGVHFRLNPGYFLIISPEKGIAEPEFDFSSSENMLKADVIKPISRRIIDKSNDNIEGYNGDFVFPVKLAVTDSAQPLMLKGNLKFTICKENDCTLVEAEPQLLMQNAPSEVDSAVSSFVRRSFNTLPKEKLEDLKIIKVVADEAYEENGNPVLRVVMKVNGKPEKADIFIKSLDGLNFYRPKITVNGNQVIARFESKIKDINLSNRHYEITAAVNGMETLRKTVVSHSASLFDTERQELSLGLILLAIIGGFILNFMPCVFPVLSLKFLSLTNFGAQQEENIRRGFIFTVIGVFSAFAFLTVMLIGLKIFGVAVGWGMQFQNPYFIVAIMFIIVLFMAQIFGLINIETPAFVNKWLNRPSASDNFLNILTGLFLVLVATPCTAPYLGTALGFALAGSNTDIAVIMFAVALGLSLPYIALAFYPELGLLMPKPGAWMNKISHFMVLMLFLTILWLGSVLYAQTGVSDITKIGFCLAFFLLLLYFRYRVIAAIEIQNESTETRKIARKLIQLVAFILSLLLLVYSFYTAAQGYTRRQSEVSVTHRLKLDKTEIDGYLKNGEMVIVKIGADWCLTCKFNDFTVFDNSTIAATLKYYKVKMIEVDWTNYDKEVLEFMKKFGRSGLPFYIIFSRNIPDGMVLPEVMTDADLVNVLRGVAS